MRSIYQVYSNLQKRLTESFEQRYGRFGFHNLGYGQREWRQISDKIWADVIGLLDDVKTSDGHCGRAFEFEDLKLAFDMLAERYNLKEVGL